MFEGQTRVDANEAIKTIFSLSEKNLLKGEYAINSEIYDKIMDTIIQLFNFDPSDVYQKVPDMEMLQSNANLKAFEDETTSVVFFCGPKRNSMLSQAFKVNFSYPKHGLLWRVLIYNSGDGLEYHQGYNSGPRKQYSPVVICEGPSFLMTQAWTDASLNFGYYRKFIKNF